MAGLADRFWAKVDKNGPTMQHMETPCWMWTGYRNEHGYGRLTVDGKVRGAHRVSLILDARDPGPLLALHDCDNPPCVNPQHLYAGTFHDNMADCMQRGRLGDKRRFGDDHWTRRRPDLLALRRKSPGGPCGDAANLRKLSSSQVREARVLYANGMLQREIAARFGVSRSTIGLMLNGKTWRSIE